MNTKTELFKNSRPANTGTGASDKLKKGMKLGKSIGRVLFGLYFISTQNLHTVL